MNLPSLEKRQMESRFWVYMSPVLALILTLVAGALLFRLMDVDVLSALYTFFIKPISTPYGLAELGVKATPLVLIGVALSLGFRAGVWNIGAEGQLVFGAIFGGGLALAFYEMEGAYILPLVLLAGIMGGMLWAGIVALYADKATFGAHPADYLALITWGFGGQTAFATLANRLIGWGLDKAENKEN